MDPLPSQAYAAALAGLSAMTPARLRLLLRHHHPRQAWDVVTRAAEPHPAVAPLLADPLVSAKFRASGADRGPEAVWQRCQTTGTAVLLIGSAGYPPVLASDHAAPSVIFVRGDLAALDHRRAAVIGTRNATAGGRVFAFRLGQELAGAGVAVVSGLARGIDGAAHRGVVRAGGAPPIAVVASGPDVPFPADHAGLWADVIERGVLISEHPPGTPPYAEFFPARNRILAALSEALIVVESRFKGGSMITVREALRRQIDVLAVPGSPLNRAAEGTNRIISEGARPVCDVDDVLVALGLSTTRQGQLAFDPRPAPSCADQRILDVFSGDALCLAEVVERAGQQLADVAIALGRLEANGWIVSNAGWFEPLATNMLVSAAASVVQGDGR
jgi:DNA processing protein